MQPQNLYSSSGARFALRGVIGLEHFGQVGAAAANISGYDSARRIFLVELPITDPYSLLMWIDSASGPAPAP
jgi:hypothetical protein